MLCEECAETIPDDAAFCNFCGWSRYGKPAARASDDLSNDPMMRMLLPVGRSPLAIAAGYFGLVSVLMFPAPIALLLGILAIRDIRRHPEKHGMGRAIFGLVMGGLFTAVLVFVLIVSVIATIHHR